MRARVLVGVVVLTLLSSAAAAEPEVVAQRMDFIERSGQLSVKVRFPKLFDSNSFERLSSGFPTTVVIQAWVYRASDEVPVSYAFISRQAVYDLWDQSYSVRTSGPAGQRTVKMKKRSDVLSALTTIDRTPVASLGRISVGPHYRLALVVSLNPISKQLLAEMRRWLTKPAGKAQLDTSSSFFGTFVSVFVNPKLREADRVMRLRSQPFYRVTR